jgi:hypothetical protein
LIPSIRHFRDDGISAPVETPFGGYHRKHQHRSRLTLPILARFRHKKRKKPLKNQGLGSGF